MEREESKKKPSKSGILLALAGLLVLVGVGTAILIQKNEFILTVHLLGPREMEIEYGEDFQDPGSYVTTRGSIFWKEDRKVPLPVTVTGEIPQGALGTFELTYQASQEDSSGSAVRKVTVVDSTAPEITLEGELEVTGTSAESPYIEAGFRAEDNYDGDLTGQVMRIERLGEILYTVTDSSGNEASVTRKVVGYDPLPPSIHLEGEQNMVIPAGRVFEDPGCSASDDSIGDISDRIETEGEVLWYVPGEYDLIYRVRDDYGNMAETRRTVTVKGTPRAEVVLPEKRTIYLTFDDGPGPYTEYLLNILKQYGVKATFFVVGSDYPDIMRRIVNEGHSIAVHSVTHNYQQIYASPEAYFADILGEQAAIKEITGVQTTLMRFPGGGSNLVSSFNEGIMSTLTEAVQDAGFQYFDWNVDSNDAGGARTSKQVLANVIGGVQGKRASIVLQHDIHPFSVLAVEEIIQWGLNNGYQFKALDSNCFGAHHSVYN